MESTPTFSVTRTPHAARRGFTLVEMLVVLSIVAVLTGVILTGQSSFNQSLVLSDTAYTIGFSARQAQNFGLSSRKYNSVQNTGYGLDFSRITPGSYTFFADTYRGGTLPSLCPIGTAGEPDAKVGDCLYTAGAGKDALVSTLTFTRGFTIGQICGRSTSDVTYCSTDPTPLDTLDVVYMRPNTTTVITGIQNGVVREMKCAQIRLDSATGGTYKYVRMSQLGEISVNQTCS